MSTRKLVRHVTKGRLSRVKRFLRDEKRRLVEENPAVAEDDAWMDEIKVRSRKHCFGDKTYLLHLAASIGDERVLRYLLKLGFGRRQGSRPQRGDLLTPLHLAVSRCHRTLKSRGGKNAIEDFQDFVKPVLDACPGALDVKNQLGERGSLVLEELQADIAREETGGGSGGGLEVASGIVKDDDDDDDDDDDHHIAKDEDRRWREKLRDECDFETEASIGKFREDHYWQEGEDERGRETFKEFAERIEREYQERFRRSRREKKEAKKRHATAGAASSSSSSKLGKGIDPAKQKQYEEMRRAMTLKNRKLDYEKRWEDFFKKANDDRLFGFDEIPWPKPVASRNNDGGVVKKLVAEMLEISTFTISDEDKERERRLEIKRWHPDKVMQKIKVKPEDAEFVHFVVKELAQALNSLKPK